MMKEQEELAVLRELQDLGKIGNVHLRGKKQQLSKLVNDSLYNKKTIRLMS